MRLRWPLIVLLENKEAQNKIEAKFLQGGSRLPELHNCFDNFVGLAPACPLLALIVFPFILDEQKLKVKVTLRAHMHTRTLSFSHTHSSLSHELTCCLTHSRKVDRWSFRSRCIKNSKSVESHFAILPLIEFASLPFLLGWQNDSKDFKPRNSFDISGQLVAAPLIRSHLFPSPCLFIV